MWPIIMIVVDTVGKISSRIIVKNDWNKTADRSRKLVSKGETRVIYNYGWHFSESQQQRKFCLFLDFFFFFPIFKHAGYGPKDFFLPNVAFQFIMWRIISFYVKLVFDFSWSVCTVLYCVDERYIYFTRLVLFFVNTIILLFSITVFWLEYYLSWKITAAINQDCLDV